MGRKSKREGETATNEEGGDVEQPVSSPPVEEVKAAEEAPKQTPKKDPSPPPKAASPVKDSGLNKPLSKSNKKGSKFDLQGQENQVLYRPEFKYDNSKRGAEKMWELMKSYLGNDSQSIQRQIVNHVEYTLARTRFDFDNFGAYQAAALAVRDRLLESWNDTQQFHTNQDCKRVYYLSLEFLMGRTF